MAERSMRRAGGSSRAGGLGANQIRWLRAHMKPFDDAWKAVQASDAHAHKVKSRLQQGPAESVADSEFDPTLGPLQRLRLVERRPRRRGTLPA